MAINTANIKANMTFQLSMVPLEDPKSLIQGGQGKTDFLEWESWVYRMYPSPHLE